MKNWKDDLALPIGPTLEEFGLEKGTIRSIKSWPEGSPVLLLVWCSVPIYLFLKTDWSWIGIIMFSLPFGGLAAIVVSLIWRGLSKWWNRRFVKGYAESEKYAGAIKAYGKDIEAYFDRQLTALGVGHERTKTIEEHHDDNMAVIGEFGRVISDVYKKYSIAVNTPLLRHSKERIRGALLDEIFACLLCEKEKRLDTLQVGLMELAIFQEIDRPLMADPVAKLTSATEKARAKGLDVPTETLIEALAKATSGEKGDEQDELRQVIVEEQAETVDLLKDLEGMAKNVRKLSEHRVWCYERYFSEEN